MVGQPQLFEILERKELAQFAQRVTAEYHLKSLTLSDTGAYISSRLRSAGTHFDDLFDSNAVKIFHYFSAGLPRLLNTLCDYALVIAYGNDTRKIGLEIALEVVRLKRIGGINRHTKRPAEAEQIRNDILHQHKVDLAALVENTADSPL